MASDSALRSLLKHAKDTVDECLPGDQPLNGDGLDGKLNEVLFAVSAAGHGSASIDLSGEDKATVWHIVCKLWVSNLPQYNSASFTTGKPWIGRE